MPQEREIRPIRRIRPIHRISLSRFLAGELPCYAFLMSRVISRFALIAAFAAVCAVAAAEERPFGRCGPAEQPERYADWGGTPDMTLSTELGLKPEEVEAVLARVTGTDRDARFAAAAELERSATGSEQTLRQVLWGDHGARNAEIRDAVQAARRRAELAGPKAGLTVLGALLEMSPADANLGAGTRAASRVMAMVSALLAEATMAAYKVVLDFSPRHAGVFRQTIGEMIVARGLDALPALVYGRGSKDPEMHMFAVAWIRDMGDPLLGEQVNGVENPRRLAQLLEAYASVKELDAIDVTVSLTNHESAFVRQAARRCIEVYGANARWPMRRLYENTFGREPADGTDVPQWSRELYDRFDSLRLAGTAATFEAGRAAGAAGDLAKMDALYRQVLRDAPMFSSRHEMAAGFLALARVCGDEDRPDEARAATMMAARVARPGSEEARLAVARLEWLEAEAYRKGGAPDAALYREIAKADPENADARGWADRFSGQGVGLRALVLKGVAVSLLLFFAVLVAYRRFGGRWRKGRACGTPQQPLS